MAIGTRDVWAIGKFMTDQYGVGPWIHMQFGDSGDGKNIKYGSIENVTLDGEYVGTYALQGGGVNMPSVSIELMQPLKGKSVFQQFLDRHVEPGIQHLCFNNYDYDECVRRFRANGLTKGQTANVDVTELCCFSDHSELLGPHIEIHKRPKDWKMPDMDITYYPADNKMPEGVVPLFTDFVSVGFVVKDADEVVRLFDEVYGVGPWKIGVGSDPNPLKVAICENLNVRMELIQPLSEEGFFAERLKKYGSDGIYLGLQLSESQEKSVERIKGAGHNHFVSVVLDGKEHLLSDHTDLWGIYFDLSADTQ